MINSDHEPKDVPYWTTKSGLNVYEMQFIYLNDPYDRLNISEWEIPKELTKEEYIDKIREPHHKFVVIALPVKELEFTGRDGKKYIVDMEKWCKENLQK